MVVLGGESLAAPPPTTPAAGMSAGRWVLRQAMENEGLTIIDPLDEPTDQPFDF